MTEFLPEEVLDLASFKASEEDLQYLDARWTAYLKKFHSIPSPNLGTLSFDTECMVPITSTTANGGWPTVCLKSPFKNTSGRRFAWMIDQRLKSIPETNANGEKVEIRFLCGTTGCVNPRHLCSGTTAKSRDDIDKRKRANPGLVVEKSGKHKLDHETVWKIRESRPSTSQDDPEYVSQQDRATRFKVPIDTIRRIDQGTSYTEVPNRDGSLVSNIKHDARKTKTRALAKAKKPSVKPPKSTPKPVKSNTKGHKLTDDQAREIHRRYHAGENSYTIARDFGISQTTVSKIGLGKARSSATLGQNEDLKMKSQEYSRRGNLLKDVEIQDIRRRHTTGESIESIAKSYGIITYRVMEIVTRKRYAEIPDSPVQKDSPKRQRDDE